MSAVREWRFVDAEALRVKLAVLVQPDPVFVDALAEYDRLKARGEWPELVLDGRSLMVMTFSDIAGKALSRSSSP